MLASSELKKAAEALLKSGDFNNMDQELQPDGSVVITFSKRKEGKTYRFKVKNLYQPNEEISEHEVIEAKPPE